MGLPVQLSKNHTQWQVVKGCCDVNGSVGWRMLILDSCVAVSTKSLGQAELPTV